MRLRTATVALVIALPMAAALAQDIRGLEICTAEKDMVRRTSCLQSNVELLQRLIGQQAREARDRDAASTRELSSLKADVAALKAALAKTQEEVAELKRAKAAVPEAKK